MPRKHPLLFSLITLMALLASTEVKGSVASRQEHKALPRVVVQILVDQLRADHLESFAPLYGEGGLRLLLREGRLYSRGGAAYGSRRPRQRCGHAKHGEHSFAARHRGLAMA